MWRTMHLYLSKLLPLLVYPVSLTLLLAGFSGLCRMLRWRWLASFTIVLAILVLWISATPAVAKFLCGALERQFPPIAIADTPTADAIIVLGGAVGQTLPPRLVPDLNDAIDRVVHAARLYRAGKAPRILIAAGNLPWGHTLRSEAELIAALLTEWGIPHSALLLDTTSRNTAENAENAGELMARHHLHTGLLVTSAGHMPRASALFQAAGVQVTPCSTDLRVVGEQRGTIFQWLPDVTALTLTTLAIKEWLGLRVSTWSLSSSESSPGLSPEKA